MIETDTCFFVHRIMAFTIHARLGWDLIIKLDREIGEFGNLEGE
jgi:hypothetical protein